MLLISEVWDNVSDRRAFVAPPFKFWLIEGYTWTNFASSALRFVGINRLLEEAPITVSNEEDFLIYIDLGIDGNFGQAFGLNERVKYLTLGGSNRDTGGMGFAIQVFGTIIDGSRIDLIWAFLRRGR